MRASLGQKLMTYGILAAFLLVAVMPFVGNVLTSFENPARTLARPVYAAGKLAVEQLFRCLGRRALQRFFHQQYFGGRAGGR